MISPSHNKGRIKKTIALIALVSIIAFVGFTASAYVASKNTDTLHGTFDPAANEFNNYLNFITGKQIQTSDDKPTVNTSTNQQPKEKLGLAPASSVIDATPTTPIEPVKPKYDMSNSQNYANDIENKLYTLINQDRTKYGLPPLQQDVLMLGNVARGHSVYMANKGYGHTGPNSLDGFTQMYYKMHKCYENIAQWDNLFTDKSLTSTDFSECDLYINTTTEIDLQRKTKADSPGHRARG